MPPTPTPAGAAPHLVLWHLAESYLTAAHALSPSLLPTPQHSSSATVDVDIERARARYTHLIRASITSLTAILKSSKRLPPTIELRTRLRLAQILWEECRDAKAAEAILSKAIILAQQGGNGHQHVGIKFACQYLLIKILVGNPRSTGTGAGRQLLKSCLRECGEREVVTEWSYAFLLLEIELGGASARGMRNFAMGRGDEEIVLYALLLEAAQNLRTGVEGVEKAGECLRGYEELLGRRVDRGVPVRNEIRLMGVVLGILRLTMCAHTAAALQQLGLLHQALDALASDPNWTPDGSFMLQVRPHESQSQMGRAVGVGVRVKWCERQELFAFGYLLSGVCHLPNYASSKSITFLDEGLKMVAILSANASTTPGSVSEVTERRRRVDVMREYLLTYMVFALLLRSEFDAALVRLRALDQIGLGVGILGPMRTMVKIAYLQSTGKFDDALALSATIPQQTQDEELLLLNLLNSVAMMRGMGAEGQGLAERMLQDLEPRCSTSKNTSLRTAWQLVRATSSSNDPNTLLHRTLLDSTFTLTSTHANTHLRTLTLTALSQPFAHTNPAQGEAMSTSAYVVAKKARDEVWCGVSGEVARGVWERMGKVGKAGRQGEVNWGHWGGVGERLERGVPDGWVPDGWVLR
ncbi:Elongator subunit elp2 [Saitoella coloradoensis]